MGLEQKQLVFIVCGEASGDLHAANLVAQWRLINPELQFKAWGGDRLAAQGVILEQHINTMSFMGFIEVLANIGTISRQFKKLKRSLLEQKPAVLVLVDYPGFNLRIAKWAHQNSIQVLYYISPTVWAWKHKRVFTIQKYVSKLYCILPFEPAFYAQFGIEVAYFGHPLQDEIEHYKSNHSPVTHYSKPVLALLPGSRPQELQKKLPLMLAAAAHFKSTHQIVVACSNSIPLSVYETYCQDDQVILSSNHTYDLLSIAALALVTSGTATLEAALFGVPQVVCYKGSALSIWLARKFVKIKYISLVNLILEHHAVTELIQEDCSVANMQAELTKLVTSQSVRQAQLDQYAVLQRLLQQTGVSKRIAQSMNLYIAS